MSPRAACRLETLGFAEVYDYTTGKADWLARGLPREGENASEIRAFELTVDDAVTCRLDDRVGDVRERVDASPYGFAFVVSGDRILLGRLRRAAFECAPGVLAEAVMEAGPSTIRAHRDLEAVAERMERNHLTLLPVTTPEGKLLGFVRRDDLERELASAQL